MSLRLPSRNLPVIIDHVAYLSLHIPFSSFEVACELSYVLFGNSNVIVGIFRNTQNISGAKSSYSLWQARIIDSQWFEDFYAMKTKSNFQETYQLRR